MRLTALAHFLLAACALSGCGERALTPTEQNQQFTIQTALTRAEALRAAEQWLASTAAELKTVVAPGDPQTGSVTATAQLPGRVVSPATASAPAVTADGTPLAITITSEDKQTVVAFVLAQHTVDDAAVEHDATANRTLAFSLAAALNGTVIKVPSAEPAPVKSAPAASAAY